MSQQKSQACGTCHCHKGQCLTSGQPCSGLASIPGSDCIPWARQSGHAEAGWPSPHWESGRASPHCHPQPAHCWWMDQGLR